MCAEGVPGGITPEQAAQAQRADTRAESTARTMARQIAAKTSFRGQNAERFNPFSADRAIEFRALEQRRPVAKKKDEKLLIRQTGEMEQFRDAAAKREEADPELTKDKLLEMRSSIVARGGTPEEILEEVLRFFADPTLADEALKFLEETTADELALLARQARDLLNERLGREVKAGYNIRPDTKEFSESGIGTKGELRDLYRDITGNPREHNALFKELSSQYEFEKLREVIRFLMQALGSDLKAKGPSIARGELYRLVTEVRVLQSILGVYYYFRERLRLINSQLRRYGKKKPGTITFESLAEEFMALIEERYPTASKVLRSGHKLEIDEDILIMITVISQYRDAIRGVAPRLYRNMKHRYDLLMAILEALEELEDELEEEEEEEEAGGDL